MLLVMLLPLVSAGQKIAVIDREYKKPVSYVSSINMGQLAAGLFVIHRENIPAVLEAVRTYRALINDKQAIPEEMKSVIKGSTYFTASGDDNGYNLVLDTKINKMGSYFVLANKDASRKENLKAVDAFIEYLAR